MREMQNIEYSYIVRELQTLENKHFSKIYVLGKRSFRIKIGDSHMVVELPLRIGLAKYIVESIGSTAFTERLRKILNNQKLLHVYQCGQDRIIALEFERHVLFLEMFAKGNIILTDKSGKIVEVFEEAEWKDRMLKRGEEYKEPKNQVVQTIQDALSEKYIIVCLLRLPLGKEYVKEMLTRCAIDEKKPGNLLSPEEIACLEHEYSKILSSQKPYLFFENGKPVDYGLTKFSKYSEVQEFSTLSEAMEEYYACAAEKKESERIAKLRRRLNEQLEALAKLEALEKEAREKGDFIYAHYHEIEKILESAKKSGINNLEAALKDYKILKIDKEKKEVELEL